jgi:phosphatidyl-myo-inositol dimannoside synthase
MRSPVACGQEQGTEIEPEGIGSDAQPCAVTSRTSPIRILFISDSFSPHAGGSREYYFNLYSELARLGLATVTIITKKVPGWSVFDAAHTSAGLRILRRFRPLRSWSYRQLPKGLLPFAHILWRVLRDSPDLIHAGDLYPQGVIANAVSHLTGIPYVIYCHGEEVLQTDHYRYQPRIRNRLYNDAATVIANSDFTRGQLLRVGVSDDRITKITPGVDSARFSPDVPDAELTQKYGLAGKLVVLTVGRLVPRKGHRTALQVVANLCKDFPELRYVIAGTGPEEHNLRQLALSLGITDRVTFTGLISAEMLPRLYRLCDVMLLANRQEANGDLEGFGMVFLEANAVAKPVVGGFSGGAIEAIDDGVTGFLADPSSVSGMENAVRKLLNNPELRLAMGSAGRKRVEALFNWNQRARALDRLNRQILKKTGKPSASPLSGSAEPSGRP